MAWMVQTSWIFKNNYLVMSLPEGKSKKVKLKVWNIAKLFFSKGWVESRNYFHRISELSCKHRDTCSQIFCNLLLHWRTMIPPKLNSDGIDKQISLSSIKPMKQMTIEKLFQFFDFFFLKTASDLKIITSKLSTPHC